MKLSIRHFLSGTRIIKFLLFPKAKLLPCFVLLLSFTAVVAQDKIPVSGTVLDSAGRGLPGVSVTEKGTKNVVITTDNGIFLSGSTIPIPYWFSAL
jgi:hypothetical protein